MELKWNGNRFIRFFSFCIKYFSPVEVSTGEKVVYAKSK